MSTPKHNTYSLIPHQSFAIAKSRVFAHLITFTLTSFTSSKKTIIQAPSCMCALANSRNTSHLGHNIIYILQTFVELLVGIMSPSSYTHKLTATNITNMKKPKTTNNLIQWKLNKTTNNTNKWLKTSFGFKRVVQDFSSNKFIF